LAGWYKGHEKQTISGKALAAGFQWEGLGFVSKLWFAAGQNQPRRASVRFWQRKRNKPWASAQRLIILRQNLALQDNETRSEPKEMKSRFLPFVVILLFASVPVVTGQEQEKPAEKPILCRGNYHSEQDAIRQLARMGDTYSTLE